MSNLVRIKALYRCANELCPNLPHEGLFVLFEAQVDGPRNILIAMCAPCASRLAALIPKTS